MQASPLASKPTEATVPLISVFQTIQVSNQSHTPNYYFSLVLKDQNLIYKRAKPAWQLFRLQTVQGHHIQGGAIHIILKIVFLLQLWWLKDG